MKVAANRCDMCVCRRLAPVCVMFYLTSPLPLRVGTWMAGQLVGLSIHLLLLLFSQQSAVIRPKLLLTTSTNVFPLCWCGRKASEQWRCCYGAWQ